MVTGLRVDGSSGAQIKSILYEFRDFIVKDIVFNTLMDGLQGFIKKNLPIKYIMSYAELDYIRLKT